MPSLADTCCILGQTAGCMSKSETHPGQLISIIRVTSSNRESHCRVHTSLARANQNNSENYNNLGVPGALDVHTSFDLPFFLVRFPCHLKLWVMWQLCAYDNTARQYCCVYLLYAIHSVVELVLEDLSILLFVGLKDFHIG